MYILTLKAAPTLKTSLEFLMINKRGAQDMVGEQFSQLSCWLRKKITRKNLRTSSPHCFAPQLVHKSVWAKLLGLPIYLYFGLYTISKYLTQRKGQLVWNRTFLIANKHMVGNFELKPYSELLFQNASKTQEEVWAWVPLLVELCTYSFSWHTNKHQY